jgi:hypothetical protein
MARIDGTIGYHPSAKAGARAVPLTDDRSLSPRVREAVRLIPATGQNYGDPSPADVSGPPWSTAEASH